MLGSCNETDFISRLLVGLAAVRAFPETDPARHTMVQSVPVDVTAAALCDLCAPRGPRRGEVLHVVSGAPPQPMASLRQALLAFGAISPNLRAASLVPVPPTTSLPPPPPLPRARQARLSTRCQPCRSKSGCAWCVSRLSSLCGH